VAPLRAAEDAIPIDTTALAFPEQVRFIVELARPIFGQR
jgi:cytidylate kinase